MTRADVRKLKRSNDRMRRSRNILKSLRNQELEVQKRVERSKVVDNIQRDSITENPEPSTEMKLRLWALKHNITRIAMGELLKILISIGLTYLPSDPRTLLETPTTIQLESLANGKFWYCGIRNNLRRIFNALKEDIIVALNFNIDGIPFFNSAKHEFWPILANIHSKRINNISSILRISK